MKQNTITICTYLQFLRTYTNLFCKHLVLFTLCALFFLITSCSPRLATNTSSTKQDLTVQELSNSSSRLLRADPGYVQWLEEQSFLHTAKELIGIVSGSSLLWGHDGNVINPRPLLEKASMWLHVSPKNMTNLQDFSSSLALLSQPSIIASLQQKGLSLYLSDIGESDFLWASTASHAIDGYDSCAPLPFSYAIAPQVGTEQEVLSLNAQLRQIDASAQNVLRPQMLGADIVSTSTGLGPDFFLAARGHKDYIGAYVMVEVPPKYWPILPYIQEDWQCQALNQAQHKALVTDHVLPPAHDWAATGAVRGVDGNARRWVYAYTANPMQAILNWNDPSGLARRIFSGSIIKNTGTLHLPLVGLSLDDLYRFQQPQDSVPETTDTVKLVQDAEPMLTASKALAHEIRSYGGWSWLRQALPTALLPHFMQSAYHDATGPDFFTSQLGNALEQALEQGHTGTLKDYFDAMLSLKIDGMRLAHIMPDCSNIHQLQTYNTTQTYTQNITLAARFLASQSGLIVYPAQTILPLTSEPVLGNKNPQSPTTFTVQELQKSIVALPNLQAWRTRYHVATAKLIARLPSSQASLILLSALANKDEHNNADTPTQTRAITEKKRYLVSISNVTNQNIHEQCSLLDYIPQDIATMQEVDINSVVQTTTDSLMRLGDTSMLTIEVPAKTCRIFIITSP